MGLRGQLPIELTNSLQILAVELYEYFKMYCFSSYLIKNISNVYIKI